MTTFPALDHDDWREALRRCALEALEVFADAHPVWRTKTDVLVRRSGPQMVSPVGLGDVDGRADAWRGAMSFSRSDDEPKVMAAGTHLRFARIDDGYADPCGHVNPVAIELRVSDGPLAGALVVLWARWDTGPKDAGILEAFEPLPTLALRDR